MNTQGDYYCEEKCGENEEFSNCMNPFPVMCDNLTWAFNEWDYDMEDFYENAFDQLCDAGCQCKKGLIKN